MRVLERSTEHAGRLPSGRRPACAGCFGLDRTGPEPRQTRRGQPLRPFTLPNLVGYVRLAAIPVFLYLALDSDDGAHTSAALVFLAIALGDYVDGFLARVTGQYSRMGALLDPVVDRLTIARRRGRLLALRAAAALGAGGAGRCASSSPSGSPNTGCATASTSRSTGWGGSPSSRSWAAIFFSMLFDGWLPTTLLIVGLGALDPGDRALRPHGEGGSERRRRAEIAPSLSTEPSTFG